MRKWLKSLRGKKGLTMAETGKKLGISESYYCAIEKGTRQVRLDMALASRISQALEVPLDIIAKEEERMRRGEEIET